MDATRNDELGIDVRVSGSGEVCSMILQELPTWFGLPASNADYAAAAEHHPTIVASIDGRPVGLLTIVQHSEAAAEVYVMAVLPQHHRRGIGAAMLDVAEEQLAEQGVEFLQVKTLDETHPDPGYVETRAFYRANGFVPLEVFPELWGSDNPALQMIKHIRR